jgi:hypothetical protein
MGSPTGLTRGGLRIACRYRVGTYVKSDQPCSRAASLRFRPLHRGVGATPTRFAFQSGLLYSPSVGCYSRLRYDGNRTHKCASPFGCRARSIGPPLWFLLARTSGPRFLGDTSGAEASSVRDVLLTGAYQSPPSRFPRDTSGSRIGRSREHAAARKTHGQDFSAPVAAALCCASDGGASRRKA